MPQYVITFNAEWVPELTEEDILERSRTSSAATNEMMAAGVWVFGGGLDDDSVVGAVDLVDGKAAPLDGPYAETKEHLGGFFVVDVPDDETAQFWAARMAVACGWPQQVHRLMVAPHVRKDGD